MTQTQSQALRAEALAILQGGVLALLGRNFGSVEIAGSVALDLMVVPDIDLYTRLESDKICKLYDLIPELAAQLARQGFTLARTAVRNEYALPDPNFPTTPGLYGGFTFVGGEVQRTWKLDFWGWNSGQYSERQKAHLDLAEKLKTADQELILRLKDSPGYGSTFFSMDVYTFVLAGAGTSSGDLERFMQQREGQF